MKLLDLEPALLTHSWVYEGRAGIAPPGGKFGDPTWHDVQKRVRSLDKAHSIRFLCPACFTKNGGAVGTHHILVSFRDRLIPSNCGSINRQGQPSRWQVSGTSTSDLSLSPSIDCGCWHGFVTNGEISTV